MTKDQELVEKIREVSGTLPTTYINRIISLCRQHEWIPVSERLPDDGQRYVALGIAEGDDEYTSMEGRYSDRVGFVPNIKLWKEIPPIDNLRGDSNE